MKKRIVFALSCLMLAPALCARDCAEQSSCGEDRIIQYTVTLYRDSEKYDVDRWERMKQDARGVVARGQQQVREDVLQVVTDAIQNVSTDGQGIHGEISVSVSDGDYSQARCGDMCACTKRYGGLCPCSKNEPMCTKSCSEKEEKTCKEACTHVCEASCEEGGSCKKSCEK
jgi:hypothetical protein